MLYKYIVLIILYFLLTGCISDNYEPEIHYIPNGYIGEIRIVMNQKDGQEKEYNSAGYRIYRIPSSGTLYTKFTTNTGWINDTNTVKYYYIDSIPNQYTRLRYCSLCYKNEIQDTNEIGVLGMGIVNGGYGDIIETALTYKVDTIWNNIMYKNEF